MENKIISQKGLPRRAESSGFSYRLEYRLTGSDIDITNYMEADNTKLVIPAFLMRFYGPSGKLINPPGPEYIKVFDLDRDVTPICTWTKPKVNKTKI